MKIYIMNHPDRETPHYYDLFIEEFGIENVFLWRSMPKTKNPIVDVFLETVEHAVNPKNIQYGQRIEKVLIIQDDVILCKNFIEIIALIEKHTFVHDFISLSSRNNLVKFQVFNMLHGKYPPLRPCRWVVPESGEETNKNIVELMLNGWANLYSIKFLEYILKHRKSRSIAAKLFTDEQSDEAMITDVIIREDLNWIYCDPPLATTYNSESVLGHKKIPFLDGQVFNIDHDLLPSAKRFFLRSLTQKLLKSS